MKKLKLLIATLGIAISFATQALTQSEFDYYLKQAKLGDSKAQGIIGMAYKNGDVVPQNNDEAIKWLRKSFDDVARYNLATMLLEHNESSDRRKEAIQILFTLADNYPSAMLLLGDIYDYHNENYKYYVLPRLPEEYAPLVSTDISTDHGRMYSISPAEYFWAKALLGRSSSQNERLQAMNRLCKIDSFLDNWTKGSEYLFYLHKKGITRSIYIPSVISSIEDFAKSGDFTALKCIAFNRPTRYWTQMLVTSPEFSWDALDDKEYKLLGNLKWFADRAVDDKASSKIFAQKLCDYYRKENEQTEAEKYCEIYDILKEETK